MAKTRSKKSRGGAKRGRPKGSPAKAPAITSFRLRVVLITSMIFLGLALSIGLLQKIHVLKSVTPPAADAVAHEIDVYQRFNAVSRRVNDLEQRQLKAEKQIVASAKLDQQLRQIQAEIEVDARGRAINQMIALNKLIDNAEVELARSMGATAENAGELPPDAQTIPILLYHVPPPDFDHQLDELHAKGYVTITPDQLADGLHHRGHPLPPKPVLITFDDGYASQLNAYKDIKKHGMKATFYIISGGARSRWCIGANRRAHDPLQPPTGCGDSYLNWSQISQLDASGVITIGAHTVDHEDLPTDSPSIQRFEILSNKSELESQLHHPIDSFAYPYGTYDATTVSIVQEAGFTTAVTTKPGIAHSLADIYTLSRVRSVYELP